MYELRNKTKYALASSAEIVSPGFFVVYQNEIMRLFDTKSSIESIVAGFGQSFIDYTKKTFAENDVYCSATLGLIKLSEMDNLAATIKASLIGDSINDSKLTVDGIQQFDRPLKLISSSSQQKSRFFDLDHVMEHLLPPSQYTLFNAQMNKTVVWKANTKRFLLGDFSNSQPNYSSYDGFFINRHCGLTTYIKRDAYPALNVAYENSSWFQAIKP